MLVFRGELYLVADINSWDACCLLYLKDKMLDPKSPSRRIEPETPGSTLHVPLILQLPLIFWFDLPRYRYSMVPTPRTAYLLHWVNQV